MPTVRLLALLMLSLPAAAQFAPNQITLGPLADSTKCAVAPVNTFTICGTTANTILISIGGSPLVAIGKGDKGDPGTAATVDVDLTLTGLPGTAASVTNVGTTQNAKFRFTVPQGGKGDKGDPGPAGVVVGSVLTVTPVCPKGQGTINAGWTTKDCVLAITAIK